MAVPVYQDSIASELVYVLNHAEVSVIVAEDQEQVDKVLSLMAPDVVFLVAGQAPMRGSDAASPGCPWQSAHPVPGQRPRRAAG